MSKGIERMDRPVKLRQWTARGNIRNWAHGSGSKTHLPSDFSG